MNIFERIIGRSSEQNETQISIIDESNPLTPVIIESHEFDKAKKKLKQLRVDDGELEYIAKKEKTLFFNNKVTVGDLNDLVSTIQDKFITNAKEIKKIKKLFNELYRALNAIDNDYIRAINENFKNNQKNLESLKNQQEEIKSISDAQEITIESLLSFKDDLLMFKKRIESIDGLHHLDEMWAAYKTVFPEIRKHIEKHETLLDELANTKADKTDVQDQFEEIQNIISEIKNSLVSQEDSISVLISFKGTLESQIHLNDIDTLWERCDEFDNQVSAITKEAEQLCVSNKKAIDELSVSSEKEHLALRKKLVWAYILAGGSFAVAIAQIVFNALGIM